MRERGNGRVLIADDSGVVRAILRSTLEGAGYWVDEAEDSVAASTLLESGAPDVVITDLEGPSLGGLGLLLAVKARWPDTAVVVLTGSDSARSQLRARTLRLGAREFLTKGPAAATQVLLAVTRTIEGRRPRRDLRCPAGTRTPSDARLQAMGGGPAGSGIGSGQALS